MKVNILKAVLLKLASAMLFDPMPGGSGLLEQLCSRFAAVVAATGEVCEN